MRTAIGLQSFSEIREGNYFYVDKTHFIKEWWDSGDSVTLIARPRRFGKTLNMSMIEHFFSVNYANRGDLFEGLFIWEDEEYRQLQGTYPVISLSFANIKERDYENARGKICELLVELYNKYSFVRDSEVLTDRDRINFDRVVTGMEDNVATLALQRLADYLSRYYGKKTIILLDEYDTPMQEAYVNGFWDELVYFIRNLFNATFKTNPYMARAIMTGITRVSKESIFSDLNHLKVVTTTSEEYAMAFGFTEEEVFGALEYFGIGSEKENVKYWYNGFAFGSYTDIYNPWSVLNFLDTKNYTAYWPNTSSNSLVSKLLKESDGNIKKDFEELLRGKAIECPIDEQIFYNQLDENETAIWSLLLASGYLKVVSYEKWNEILDGDEPKYTLTLTNNEVKIMFYQMVRGWFGKVKSYHGNFVKALLRGDVESMNFYMNDISFKIFSYFDTGSRRKAEQSERFYHGFVLGLLVELNNQYEITSNRESGYGRYDVMLEPKDKKNDAMILEFKALNEKKEKSLEETAEMALRQIEEKQYETILVKKGIAKEKIRKYGFAFEGKNVLISGE